MCFSEQAYQDDRPQPDHGVSSMIPFLLLQTYNAIYKLFLPFTDT